MSRKRCGSRPGRWCRCASGNKREMNENIEDPDDPVEPYDEHERQIVAMKRLVAREVLKDFCDSSTIHGLKYLRTSSVHEKVMWIIIFMISISFCAFQISNIWKRWSQDPVIVSFNENLVPIIQVKCTLNKINLEYLNDQFLQIPFPAVTICHQIKTRKSLFDYGAIQAIIESHGIYYHKLNDTDIQQFQLLATTCLKDHTTYEIKDLLKQFEDFDEPITQNFLLDLEPLINETLRTCYGVLEARLWKCHEGFGKLLTEDGVCYTFNLLNSTELLTNGT